jgi:hypothetical protein
MPSKNFFSSLVSLLMENEGCETVIRGPFTHVKV